MPKTNRFSLPEDFHRERRTRRPTILTLLVAPVVAAIALTLGLAGTAQAAPIDSAITAVTVSPTNPREGTQLTTEIDWSVPNGTMAGDTFTLTLSTNLQNLPTGFTLKDPATGAVVATAALSGSSPKLVTFTMTAYAQTHLNTSGKAFIQSDFSSTTTPSDVGTPFTFTTGDGRTFSTTVTPSGVVGTRADPSKYGSYARDDQGRTNGTDFLIYHIDTPAGPFDSAVTTDTVPAGQTWRYDCATLTLTDNTVGAEGELVAGTPVATATSTCSETELTVAWPAAPEGHVYRARIAVSLPAPTGEDTPAQTFLNTASVATTVAGATRTVSVGSSDTQASAGGTGDGTTLTPAVTIVKGDSNGNAADTASSAAVLGSTGAATLVYTITNTGDEPLTGVDVTDQVLTNGTVRGLTCDFSALGGPTSGTTWRGPFAVGASFPCRADLSDVTAGSTDHQDVGRVTATGSSSGIAVSASNAYFARVSAPAVAAAVASGQELAYTGSQPAAPLGVGLLLLAVGAGFVVVAARRRTARS